MRWDKIREDLYSYSSTQIYDDYRAAMNVHKEAIKNLFIESDSKEIKVSRKNWVEISGFTFNGISLGILESIIDIKKAKISYIGGQKCNNNKI